MTTSGSPVATATRPSGPNGWLVIGGVLTVLLIAAGTLSVAGWLGVRSETQSQTYRHDAEEISIEISNGDVTLVAGEPGLVSVERRLRWSYAKPTYDERWDGRTLHVTTDCRAGQWLGPQCGIDYTLAVPETVAVRVRTSTGDIAVRDLRGELRLSTSTGDVTAVDVASPAIDVSTSTGDIRLTVTAPPQTVTARTGTGDVTVRVPEGGSYRVQTDTGIGDTRISVPRDNSASRSITVRTSTGDIFVGTSN